LLDNVVRVGVDTLVVVGDTGPVDVFITRPIGLIGIIVLVVLAVTVGVERRTVRGVRD
jgi:hypothetical protein